MRAVAPKEAVCTVFVSSNIHQRILFSNSSFKRFNFTLFEQQIMFTVGSVSRYIDQHSVNISAE